MSDRPGLPLTRVLWTALALAGCSGPSSSVSIKAELIRLQNPGAGLAGASIRGGGSAALNYPWSMVNITSLRGPVTQINLGGTGHVVVLYQCDATSSDDCLVELNGPALQDLLGSDAVTVAPDTYDRVSITYCKPPETGYHSFVTASVALNGGTWFTRASGNLGTTGPAEAVRMSHAGCSKDYQIFPPLVVEDTISATIPLRLYFDIRDIAYAALGDPTTNPGWAAQFSCTPVATLSVTPYVCDTYPDIAAVRGTVPPVEERYRVNGGATIGLLFDTSDRFVGGYFRRYFVEGAVWNPHFFPDSFVETLTANGDGSYRLHQVDGSTFPNWRRESHSGTATEATGMSFAYTAVRLP